jgi:hypothetical protein
LCRRTGFNLIKLLVAIAIVVALIALPVPAVHRVREAVARPACPHIRPAEVSATDFERGIRELEKEMDTLRRPYQKVSDPDRS